MKATDQGTRVGGRSRHQAIPRTLIFLTRADPATGTEEILLLKGAPTKRLWANRYNGFGGHVEFDEDVDQAARRELHEETGLEDVALTLRGVVTIDTGEDEDGRRPGVLVFVFHGESGEGESGERLPRSSQEGEPAWIPVAEIADYSLVDDLYQLIPLTLGTGPLFYAHYRPRDDGSMEYRFSSQS